MNLSSVVPFEKLHGARNDFVFMKWDDVPDHKQDLNSLSHLAATLCERRSGIGADGLILWSSNGSTPALVTIINNDGSLAGTCGNALRCLGLVLHRKNLWNGNSKLTICYHPQLQAPTPFAELICVDQMQPSNSTTVLAQVRVKMGIELSNAISLPSLSEVNLSCAKIFPEFTLLAQAYIQLANPHWIFYSESFRNFSNHEFGAFGSLAQNQFRTSAGSTVPVSNIGMVYKDRLVFKLVTYERGVGLTECCGSGATATRAALEQFGLCTTEAPVVRFVVPGGTVAIGWYEGERTLEGPAAWVAEGIVQI